MTSKSHNTSPSGNQACMSALHLGVLRHLPVQLQELADLQQCLVAVKAPSLIEEFQNRVLFIRDHHVALAPKFALRSQEKPRSVELKALAAVYGQLSQAWLGTSEASSQTLAEQAENLIEDGVSDDLEKIIADAFGAAETCITACA